MRARLFCVLLGPLLGACVTTPAPSPPNQPGISGDADEQVDPFLPPAAHQGSQTPLPVPRAISFEDLPGWDEASLTGAVEAFSRSCNRWQGKQDADPVSARISYAGTIGEWRPACAVIEAVQDS